MRNRAALSAVLLAASVVGTGCDDTSSTAERGVSPPAAGLVYTGAITGALLAAEIAWVVDADEPDLLVCPALSIEGDDLHGEYADCVPESGLTSDVFGGAMNLTVPIDSGLFDGTVSALGSGASTATGAVTGSASRAGDLLSADVTLSAVAWADLRGETPSVTAFYAMDGDADEIVVTVDGGVWDRGQGRVYDFWFEEVVVPRGELDTCTIPTGGTIRVQRDGVEAHIDFTPEAAEAGSVNVLVTGDDEPASLRPCG